jgi:preprotein translocase subunit SecD
MWKYLLLAFALAVGLVYTLPNFFGEAPAVQVSSGKATLKIDSSMVGRVEQILSSASIKPDFVQFEGNSVKARLVDTDTQIKAKDALSAALNTDPSDPSYIVALNLVSRSPQWLTKLHALPMYLGLDLRGGVHFLMQVDMKAALTKKAESLTGDLRGTLRDKNIRHAGINREGNTVEVRFRDAATLRRAQAVLAEPSPTCLDRGTARTATCSSSAPQARARAHGAGAALKQNITTLHNRVNELGVAEPVIQQQGADRVVVQLPGVQDTAKAKDIIGRTATLELRLVDDAPRRARRGRRGPVPFGASAMSSAAARR